jgi:hypothetical protein
MNAFEKIDRDRIRRAAIEARAATLVEAPEIRPAVPR